MPSIVQELQVLAQPRTVHLWASVRGKSETGLGLRAASELAWPIVDVPRFGRNPDVVPVVCTVGKCTARDVWNSKDMAITSKTIPIALEPFASAFFILTSTA